MILPPRPPPAQSPGTKKRAGHFYYHEKPTFAARLKSAREQSGLTQRALAAQAGITQSAYQQLESGKTQPRLSTVVALAEALGRSVAELAGS